MNLPTEIETDVPLERLRERAKNMLGRIHSAIEVWKQALAANAGDAARLEKLTQEIGELEPKVNAENLDEVVALSARREQKTRLAKKFAEDSARRLAEADGADNGISDSEVSSFVRDCLANAKGKLELALRPFANDEPRLQMFISETSTVRYLQKLANAAGSLPSPQRYDTLIPFLDEFSNYTCPPWLHRMRE